MSQPVKVYVGLRAYEFLEHGIKYRLQNQGSVSKAILEVRLVEPFVVFGGIEADIVICAPGEYEDYSIVVPKLVLGENRDDLEVIICPRLVLGEDFEATSSLPELLHKIRAKLALDPVAPNQK